MVTKKYCLFHIIFFTSIIIQTNHVLANLDTPHDITTKQEQPPSILETQNYEVARGINYEYVHVEANKNSNRSKETILFLHGFPSTFHCWRHQIEYFSRQGYGCLAPNLMGYGKTYSPLSKDEYKIKSMVEHLITLLDHLHLDRVFVVGHDWGTRLANRFTLYYPERTLGLGLISIGYQAPAMFDLDRSLENLKKAFGYETLGYWKFFDTDNAATIIETNVESFIDLTFTNNPIQWKTDFAPIGQMQNWLISGRRASRATYMTEEDFKIIRQTIIEGMQPKLNWYKAAITNVDWDDVKNIDPKLKRPVLFIGGKRDYVCIIASFAGQKQYMDDLEVIELDASHWVMEEKPDEVNQGIGEWIKRLV